MDTPGGRFFLPSGEGDGAGLSSCDGLVSGLALGDGLGVTLGDGVGEASGLGDGDDFFLPLFGEGEGELFGLDVTDGDGGTLGLALDFGDAFGFGETLDFGLGEDRGVGEAFGEGVGVVEDFFAVVELFRFFFGGGVGSKRRLIFVLRS